MQNREISRQIQQLHSLIARTYQASADDIEMQSHWAKYICVLSAGLLENALSELYAEYAQKVASAAVASYVRTSISKIQNPKTIKFIETAGTFKKEWADELADFASDEGRKDAVNSIMSNRHLIAHGKQSDISMARVKEYLRKSIELIELIEEQCTR